MGRAEIASKFVEGFEADEYAGWRIQHAVFGIEALNRCSAARRITLAEDFLKVAMEQFVGTVGHGYLRSGDVLPYPSCRTTGFCRCDGGGNGRMSGVQCRFPIRGAERKPFGADDFDFADTDEG